MRLLFEALLQALFQELQQLVFPVIVNSAVDDFNPAFLAILEGYLGQQTGRHVVAVRALISQEAEQTVVVKDLVSFETPADTAISLAIILCLEVTTSR